MRNLLHKNKLEDFKTYLVENGWIIQDTKGVFEVLRAVNPDIRKRPLIVYSGKSAEHYSLDDRDADIVRNFINGNNKASDKEQTQSCKDCNKYDKEKNSCQEFCEVIRRTCEENKQWYVNLLQNMRQEIQDKISKSSLKELGVIKEDSLMEIIDRYTAGE